jgi:CheY-like chemotaxis protein
MSRLLDDLLDIARITRGQLSLKMAPEDLRMIVADAADAARPQIEKKGHTFDITLPDPPIRITVDAVRMAQVLSNLLTNAAKYTDPGGKIALSAVQTAQSVRISVRDSGIGIRPDAVPLLFEMFSQVEPSLDRSEGGLGIGLALVRGLVKLHGGHIEVYSAGEGLGSEFCVVLPNQSVRPEPILQAAPVEKEVHAAAPALVLIADDNHDSAMSLGMLLELSENKVLLAHNGADAVELARRHRPQVVILDIGMPGMNGYQAAQKIRSESWGKNMLLIALTGWGQKNDKDLASEAGFDHHLTKPVDADDIQKLINARLLRAV